MSDYPRSTALCIGHPGHELKVYGWMEKYHPLVDVITDGSGPNRASRFASTRQLIEGTGASLGILQGAFTDRAFYDLILNGDPMVFVDLAARLATQWEDAGIEVVAGDMIEGFSTTHDVCRMVIDAAVEKLRQRGRILRNLEFPLESIGRVEGGEGEVVIHLDDAAFARKRKAAVQAYPELTSEVDRLISKYGESAFSIEILTPAKVPSGLTWEKPDRPFYETYGQKQVEAGHYQRVIRFEEHIRPIGLALWKWAGTAEE